MSVFKINQTHHTAQMMFFGPSVDIQRFDVVKYPIIEQMNRQHIGQFWVPEEFDLSRDNSDFNNKIDAVGKHIFTSNLQRQIVLDSIQGRGPALTLLKVCSLPEVEGFINTWSFFEGSIHSRSYTHIIRNIYANPSEVFDTMKNIKEIVGFADSIAKYYDDFIYYTTLRDTDNRGAYQEREHKKKLWLLLHAINALEGIRFYVSFACSWAFAENKLLVGNADVVKAICKDENIHLAFTHCLLKNLPIEDPEYLELAKECRDECIQIFEIAVQQEKEWAQYLFKDGSIIGLNAEILCNYVDWLGTKRMKSVGFKRDCLIKSNPLPWTVKWINSGDADPDDIAIAIQTAPQEKELTDYLTGAINDDVVLKTFSGFSLD